MPTVTLGRTGLASGKNAFGALPIQRTAKEEAVRILREAYERGFTYYDSARGYSDSEEKLGAAFHGMRDKILIATKTPSKTAEGFWKDLETSLRMLQTDYIDLYQFHNPAQFPQPDDGSGLYEAMLEAKKQGKIRFIGITNHRLPVAEAAVDSGLYDTLQFPFSYLSDEKDIALVKRCQEKNIGFIAMKALSGGLIQSAAAAYAFMLGYENVLPIWGIQHMREMEEFAAFAETPPALNEELEAAIQRDRRELAGNFCRGCGYCQPCPAGIDIPTCARISLLLRRSPAARFLEPDFQRQMARIEECRNCGHCINHCPYGLNTPELLRANYEDYKTFLR